MNLFFILLRLLNYLILLGFTMYFGHTLTWAEWVVSFLVIVWGTWDVWKKPNEPLKRMRYGIWLEALMITLWVITLKSNVLLFAYISPLARTSIHLSIMDRVIFLISCSVVIGFYGGWVPGIQLFIPLLVFLLVVGYSSLIGSLVSERQRAQRLIGLSEFEREHHVREQERVRISRQLHDTMGQFWTAVIRTIDVAEAVDMPTKQLFIQKARKAAEQGLTEMRKVVHNANEGKQTPEQWIRFALKSIDRLKELTNIEIELEFPNINWESYHHRVEISELIARVMMESLSNAIRHGMATRVRIVLREKDEELALLIHDNGVGFFKDKQADLASHGIGFVSLQEMAKDAGGTFQIDSERGRGTTVYLTIPLKKGSQYD